MDNIQESEHASPNFTITPATAPSDMPAIKEVLLSYASTNNPPLAIPGIENLPGLYGPPTGLFLIARSSSKYAALPASTPLGIIAYKEAEWTPPKCCEMNRLYVLPATRGMGLGKALVFELFRVAREKGYKTMLMGVFADNVAAVKLYEGVGFRKREPYKLEAYKGIQAYEIAL